MPIEPARFRVVGQRVREKRNEFGDRLRGFQ